MSKKIFIIEDDVNLLSGLKAQFSVAGLEVITNSGTEDIENILHQLSINKPDFIILDIILPRLDGFGLLNSIKSDQDKSIIPIFIFTDLSDEDIKSRCYNLGADYYFIKSEFNINEFVEKVKKIIINRERIKIK